jgi:hypothetical protein
VAAGAAHARDPAARVGVWRLAVFVIRVVADVVWWYYHRISANNDDGIIGISVGQWSEEPLQVALSFPLAVQVAQ